MGIISKAWNRITNRSPGEVAELIAVSITIGLALTVGFVILSSVLLGLAYLMNALAGALGAAGLIIFLIIVLAVATSEVRN